jgi:hypothetical protein
MNWKERGRKGVWPNLKYCPSICVDALRVARISMLGQSAVGVREE